MFIAIDDLETQLGDVEEDEVAVPRLLGLCANPIGAFEFCLKPVFDDDIEMVELPMKNNRRQFICGSCCDRLLSVKPVVEQPQKVKSHKKGRTGARLPMGEDL